MIYQQFVPLVEAAVLKARQSVMRAPNAVLWVDGWKVSLGEVYCQAMSRLHDCSALFSAEKCLVIRALLLLMHNEFWRLEFSDDTTKKVDSRAFVFPIGTDMPKAKAYDSAAYDLPRIWIKKVENRPTNSSATTSEHVFWEN